MADDTGDGDDRQQQFMSALVTEHFVLQSASAATISEGGSRSSLYVFSLSSTLVALGFASQSSERAFLPFAAVALPTLFVLGCFTIVRLVDISIENVRNLRSIARIRTYYAGLVPEARRYFPSSGDEASDAQDMLGGRYQRATLLFTMASMIAAVNAVLGGSVVTLLLAQAVESLRVPVVAGLVAAIVLLLAALRYQQIRFGAAFPRGTRPGDASSPPDAVTSGAAARAPRASA